MTLLSCVVCALGFVGQASAPTSQPAWLAELSKLQQEAADAPIGSLDQRVDQAWAAALQAPRRSQFPAAAQMAASFYESQGYDLKAERILRQALSVTPEADSPGRRILMSQLAAHLENTQQLVKALAIRKELAKDATSGYELSALARLYERMGEIDKAEAAWKQAARKPADKVAVNGAAAVRFVAVSGNFAAAAFLPTGPAAAQNELADFYTRHGRTAEAERVYSQALSEAERSGSPVEWKAAANGYIEFLARQRRFDEALDLARRSIARLEESADPDAGRALFYAREQLANLLTQAGRSEAALALRKQLVDQTLSRQESVQAFASLAEALINLNRLDEAEEAVARMREAGASDGQNARFHESMAAQILARIRDMQNRPREAQQLRASVGVPDPSTRPATIYEFAAPAEQAALRGEFDSAVAAGAKAMAFLRERVLTRPQDAAGIVSLAQILADRGRQPDAQRLVMEALQLLARAPDHPRVAEALGAFVGPLCSLGMRVEAERVIERQKEILTRAKGSDSPALNAAANSEIALMQRDSNWAGALDARKRMLARTENATGPKSLESLYALRELAWAYVPAGNWPEEERVLSDLLARTAGVLGRATPEYPQLLDHMANRASQNGEFDKAMAWIDQAIEIARALPDGNDFISGMIQDRTRMEQAKSTPAGGPYCRVIRAPAPPGKAKP